MSWSKDVLKGIGKLSEEARRALIQSLIVRGVTRNVEGP